MDRNIIYNEDCFETMTTRLKPHSIDIVITSPPCNITKRNLNASDITWKNEDEYIDWICNVFNSLHKIIKEDGVALLNFNYSIENPSLPYKLITIIEKETDFRLVDTIMWKKKCGIPFPSNKFRLSRIFEFVFVLVDKEHMNSYTNNRRIKSVSEKTGQSYYDVQYNYIEAANNDGKCKLNQATFSSDLIIQLLRIYCNSEAKRTVYDPFMGTGTTAAACIKYDAGENKIEFFGSEISKEQCKYAEERIKDAKRRYAHKQLKLFETDDF